MDNIPSPSDSRPLLGGSEGEVGNDYVVTLQVCNFDQSEAVDSSTVTVPSFYQGRAAAFAAARHRFSALRFPVPYPHFAHSLSILDISIQRVQSLGY